MLDSKHIQPVSSVGPGGGIGDIVFGLIANPFFVLNSKYIQQSGADWIVSTTPQATVHCGGVKFSSDFVLKYKHIQPVLPSGLASIGEFLRHGKLQYSGMSRLRFLAMLS